MRRDARRRPTAVAAAVCFCWPHAATPPPPRPAPTPHLVQVAGLKPGAQLLLVGALGVGTAAGGALADAALLGHRWGWKREKKECESGASEREKKKTDLDSPSQNPPTRPRPSPLPPTPSPHPPPPPLFSLSPPRCGPTPRSTVSGCPAPGHPPSGRPRPRQCLPRARACGRARRPRRAARARCPG